jgi:hypothetical protein
MNFESYYNKQDLKEFGDFAGSVAAVGQGIGKGLNLVGKGIGKLVGSAIKDLVKFSGYSAEALKDKSDNVIKLAEYIYPFDKAIYEKFKALPDKKNVWLNYKKLVGSGNAPIFQDYSVGLDIVFRAYSAVVGGVSKELLSPSKKPSMKSLIDGTDRVDVNIKKMTKPAEVEQYFEQSGANETSMISKWIEASIYFSTWKIKYENNDDESVESPIVKLAISMPEVPLKVLDTTMVELDSQGTEINAENVRQAMNISTDKIIPIIKSKLDGGLISGISYNEQDVSDEDIKNFIDLGLRKFTKGSPIRNPDMVGKYFVACKYILEQSGWNLPLEKVFDVSNFPKVFSKIKESKTIIKGAPQQTFLKNFGDFVGGKLKDSKGTTIPLTKENLQLQKLFSILSAGIVTKQK